MASKPKATAADKPPAPTTMKCWHCGADKPIPAAPGHERYETDADGNVLVDEYCPQCHRGEIPHDA